MCTVTADAGGIAEATLESILNGIAYKNTDTSPTTGQTRVVTITTLQDNGGTANSGDDGLRHNRRDRHGCEHRQRTHNHHSRHGCRNRGSAGTTDTATDTMVGSDGDGDAITWGCSSCSSRWHLDRRRHLRRSIITAAPGPTLWTTATQTPTPSTGATRPQTHSLVTATANGQSASHNVVITVTGANDLPTSSAGSASTTRTPSSRSPTTISHSLTSMVTTDILRHPDHDN